MVIKEIKRIIDIYLIYIITFLTICFAIYTYFVLGRSPETFIAIATIALVGATIYLAYFNNKLWLAQDKPVLIFELTKSRKESGFNSEDSKHFVLYVKNIGKGAAFDINFSFYLSAKSIIKIGFGRNLRRNPDHLDSVPLLLPHEEKIVIEGEIPISLLYPNSSALDTEVLIKSPPKCHIENLSYKDINDVKIEEVAHIKSSFSNN